MDIKRHRRHQIAGHKGALASLEIIRKQKEKRIEKYLQSPNFCKCCKKQLSYKKRSNKFCDHKCTAIYTNSVKPKRIKRVHKCETCNEIIEFSRKYCKKCCKQRKEVKLQKFLNLTLRQAKVNNKFYREWRQAIGLNAKITFRKNKPEIDKCERCNYTYHVDVCHIKSVSTFSDDALIKEINDMSNLIALCPNCHWELDHKIFTLKDKTAYKKEK